MSAKLGTVVLGGGRGFIGDAVRRTLQASGYNIVIVSRKPLDKNSMTWMAVEREGLPKCVAVINVAGNKFLDPTKKWTPEFQQIVCESRVNTTRTLARAIERSTVTDRPKVFATISGVGYYKPSETVVHDESSAGGDFDFFSRLVTDWEAAATLSDETSASVRRVVVRSGVVLGREGGLVSQLIWPFFFGLGGPIGAGRQYMPWIHVHDLARIFEHVVRQPPPPPSATVAVNVLNGVAPQLVTNKEFSKAFARALWRPALLPMPTSAVVLAFGRDRANVMTDSLKVVPKRTLEIGFRYNFPNIESACEQFAKIIYTDEHMFGYKGKN